MLRAISRIEESGLNLQTSLFRPDLMGGARPAQVIDFLNDDVAVSVSVRSMHQVLTIAIGVGMLQVPAVSHLPLITQAMGEVTQTQVTVPDEILNAVEGGLEQGSRRAS